jgi:hypothetical protein
MTNIIELITAYYILGTLTDAYSLTLTNIDETYEFV